MTLTPSEMRVSSVGWWMLVSTTVPSMRSLRPRLTFRERANSTARSLSDATVSEPIVLAQRMRVVSSGDLQIEPPELPQDDGIVHESLGVGA